MGLGWPLIGHQYLYSTEIKKKTIHSTKKRKRKKQLFIINIAIAVSINSISVDCMCY